jgi:hypothetical protein
MVFRIALSPKSSAKSLRYYKKKFIVKKVLSRHISHKANPKVCP